jgi:hypothetical protein
MGMFGANVGGKLAVALQLEVPHHFIEGIARGRAGGLEDPGACGATKTSKATFFDPYELASGGHYRRKTKSRACMFCAIVPSSPLSLRHHSMHLSGPPQECAQLAVSIRHQADPAHEITGSNRVPLVEKQVQTADNQLGMPRTCSREVNGG